jgi:hypothetical protein
MSDNLLNWFLKSLWFYATVLILVIVSFICYTPCFFQDYNSDQAIQSLMSVSFEFKRDFFYWGQNRLGSFLPMVTYLFFKLSNFHPLYLISVIDYALLLSSGAFISTFIQNKWIKIAVFVCIFLPVTDYRAIILIGHPYSVQLFCGSLFIFTVAKIYTLLTAGINQTFNKHSAGRLIPLCIINALSFCIGFWTSELSVILILIPIISLLLNKNLKKLSGTIAFYIALILFTVISVSFYIFFTKMKKQLPPDEIYDHSFFFNTERIHLQFGFLTKKFNKMALFKDNLFYDNLFYYLLFFLLILFFFLKRDKIKNIIFTGFYRGATITLLLSFVMLFFSTWNLRSEFSIRYHTPLYYIFIMLFLVAIDKKFSFKKASVFGLVFILFSSYYTYNFFHGKNNISALKQYNEFSKLPQGTLIAGYWDAYLISSIAYENLTPLTFDNEMCRNIFMLDTALKNKNFYFINNEGFKKRAFKDTLKQFNHTFVFTGKKYTCNAREVLTYKLQN